MPAQHMLQLDPPIPVDTPRGPAMAVLLIDYGIEHDLMWVTFTDDKGECWTWPNPKIRARKNITLGRRVEEPQLLRSAAATA